MDCYMNNHPEQVMHRRGNSRQNLTVFWKKIPSQDEVQAQKRVLLAQYAGFERHTFEMNLEFSIFLHNLYANVPSRTQDDVAILNSYLAIWPSICEQLRCLGWI